MIIKNLKILKPSDIVFSHFQANGFFYSYSGLGFFFAKTFYYNGHELNYSMSSGTKIETLITYYFKDGEVEVDDYGNESWYL